jgi:site-specific DNA-methyltransferase (adenine-specific)
LSSEPVIIQDATLYRGDCLVEMVRVADGSVDMILADLPYGTTACKWDSVIPFEPLWAHYKRIIKPRGAIVLTASQPFTSALVMSNPKAFRHEWVWEKSRASNFQHATKGPLKHHESVLVFATSMPIYNPQMRKGSQYVTRRDDRARTRGTLGDGHFKKIVKGGEIRSNRYPKSIIQFRSMRQQNRNHPTQKPVALMEYLIKTYTNEGETVLDNTMGSGTTGVACVNTGRKFIGIERDETYFGICVKRITEAYAEMPLLQEAS